jgi:glycosyltransferase involved in cell wall biosynthesis
MLALTADTEFQFAAPQSSGLLSVVVPVRNDAEGLCRTLASLAAARPPAGGMEIIVGNDGADPAASALAAAYGAKDVAISSPRGSYGARNRAMAQARGEWIAFTEADATVAPGWMKAGVAAMGGSDYACGPVIIPQDAVRTAAHVYDWLNAFPVERYLRRMSFAPTVNLFVRRSAIERIGGFDPRLMSGGDVEFGTRVRAAGLRQIYSEEIRVFHPPRSYREQLRKVRRVTRGQCDLARNHPERFAEFRPNLRKMSRNLLPPRRLEFLNHRIDEFGPRAVRLRPLLYMMAWSFRLQRLRAQLTYILTR